MAATPSPFVVCRLLITLIVTVVPISLLLQWLFSPLLKPKLERLKAELERPSGSQEFKLQKYAP